jgi:regulator of sigma E protease
MFDFILGSDALSAIVAFILVLIPAVLIHELGHFLTAKAVGITVLEFGIFMPPRLLKLFTWRGTEVTLNWLPLGGFVRPLGEDMVRQVGDAAEQEDRVEARARGLTNLKSVNEAKPRERILFMAGGALFNFIAAFVLFAVIALMGIPEIVGGRTNIVSVPEDSALAQAGLLPGDVVESVNGTFFDDSGELSELLYAADDDSMLSLSVRRADVEESLTIEVPASAFAGDPTFSEHPLIAAVAEDTPAAQAGLQPGDLVTAFNGEPIARYEVLQELTRQNLGEEISLTLWRAGQTIETSLIPRVNPPEGQGAMGIEIGSALLNPALSLVYYDGFPQQIMRSQPLDKAIVFGFNQIIEVFNTILSVPAQIIQGTAQGDALRITSPLGISQVGGVFLQESIQRDQPTIILEFIALINIALGFTNLLPIPALDGGRILFVIIEIIRGRAIAPEREGMVHLVGLVLLLSLMVVVVLNDIINPFTDLLR